MLGLTDVFMESFQRAPETPASAREVQPRVFRAGDSPFPSGLPGLIADSLPDTWAIASTIRAADRTRARHRHPSVSLPVI
jgi:hypothetical protein